MNAEETGPSIVVPKESFQALESKEFTDTVTDTVQCSSSKVLINIYI